MKLELFSFVFLVQLLTIVNTSCPLTPGCSCQDSEDGYKVVCGTRIHLAWSNHTKEVVMVCGGGVASNDLQVAMKDLPLQNIQKMRVKQCSLTDDDLQELEMVESEVGLEVLVMEDMDFTQGSGSGRGFEWLLGLKTVTSLEIVYSNAVHLTPNTFNNMEQLQSLILKGNTGIKIKDETLSKLENLKTVEISNCEIKELEEKTFSNLKKLQNLDLQSNYLTSLPSGLFKDLSSLEELNLSLNRLNSLPADLFINLQKLKRLSLNHNQLAMLHNKGFIENTRLERLEVTNNGIGEITGSSFTGLKNLRFLDLSRNKIVKIERNSFQDTQQLVHLHLHGNQLKRIDLSLVGHKNSKLTYLDLSDNKLVSADIGSGIFAKLAYINMSNNSIKRRISHTLRVNCRRLETLDLSHNRFSGTMKKKDLDVFKSNVSINLSNNSINRLDMRPPLFNFARYKSASGPSPYQTKVRLQGNPMLCDCFAADLKERLTGRSGAKTGLVFEDFSCSGGASLDITDYHDLTCPLPGYGYSHVVCPDSCTCYYNRYYSRVVVGCGGTNLTTFPASLPVVKDSDTIALNLSSNSITTIGQEVTNISNIHQVEQLDLSGNLLSEIDHTNLPPSLAHLTLTNNNISTITTNTLKYFKTHNFTMEMSENPFSCSCNSSHLYHFLQQHGGVVRDYHNITVACAHYTPLYHASLSQFCFNRLSYTPDIVVTIICVVTILAIILCYYHRRVITIYIAQTGEDSDKEYDTFLSYSHHDADYVERILYPGLAQSHTCCIHTLHWEVGRMIPDQIVESVRNSRRTIIVLSQGYLESVWTRLEFKAALEEGAQVLSSYWMHH